jgi:hypothetical protein
MAFHVPEVVKKHPAVFGIGAVVIFFLIYLALKGGGSSTSSTTSAASGPDPTAALNASTQLQLASLSLQGQQAQLSEQYAQAQDATAAGLAVQQLQAQVQSLQINKGADVATLQAQLDAAYQTHYADVGLASTLNNNATTVALQNIVTSGALQTVQAETAANVNINASNNATTLGIAGINAQLQGLLGGYSKDVNLAQIKSNVDIANQQANVAIAQQNAQVTIAKAQASSNDNSNILSGVAGFVSGLFG